MPTADCPAYMNVLETPSKSGGPGTAMDVLETLAMSRGSGTSLVDVRVAMAMAGILLAAGLFTLDAGDEANDPPLESAAETGTSSCAGSSARSLSPARYAH